MAQYSFIPTRLECIHQRDASPDDGDGLLLLFNYATMFSGRLKTGETAQAQMVFQVNEFPFDGPGLVLLIKDDEDGDELIEERNVPDLIEESFAKFALGDALYVLYYTVSALAPIGSGAEADGADTVPDGYDEVQSSIVKCPMAEPSKIYEVFLTFDDGPGYGTDAIVQVLDKLNAPSTFLIKGRNFHDPETSLREKATDDPAMSRRAFQVLVSSPGKHLIGNHSDMHDYRMYRNTNQMVVDFVGGERDGNEQVVEEAYNRLGSSLPEEFSKYARLPGCSTWRVHGLRPSDANEPNCPNNGRVADALQVRGYQVFGWETEWRIKKGTYYELDQTPQELATTVWNTLKSEKGTRRQGKLIILGHDRYFKDGDGTTKLAAFIEAVREKACHDKDNVAVEFKTLRDY